MKKELDGTKRCKHCQTEIPVGAKVCPNCRKKQGMGCLPKILIAVAVVVILALIGSSMGSGDSTEVSVENNADTSGTQTEAQAEAPKSEKIKYEKCSVDDMMELLNKNAAKASKTYKDKHLEVTGVLNNIDSDLSYIDLVNEDEFAIIGVQCYIQNEEQEDQVLELEIGDTVTVRGTCTDVGEVMGYSLDIEEIK